MYYINTIIYIYIYIKNSIYKYIEFLFTYIDIHFIIVLRNSLNELSVNDEVKAAT